MRLLNTLALSRVYHTLVDWGGVSFEFEPCSLMELAQDSKVKKQQARRPDNKGEHHSQWVTPMEWVQRVLQAYHL